MAASNLLVIGSELKNWLKILGGLQLKRFGHDPQLRGQPQWCQAIESTAETESSAGVLVVSVFSTSKSSDHRSEAGEARP